MTRTIIQLTCWLLASSVLTACGGSSSGKSKPTDYSTLVKNDRQSSELKLSSTNELEQHLKNGIRIQLEETYGYSRTADVSINGTAVSPAAEFDTEASSSEFSETNNQVSGVDEADFVKYDGTHLYVSTHPEFIWGEETPDASITIYETSPTQASSVLVGSIPVTSDNWGEISELYLVRSMDTDVPQTTGLVSLRSSWSMISAAEPAMEAAFTDIWGPVDDKIQLALYDVTDPTTPLPRWGLEIDGYLHGSRKIGNTLYLVTGYNATLRTLMQYHEENREHNEDLIHNADLSELLPKVSINGGEPQVLHGSEQCYLPNETTEYHGLNNLVTLVAIDLSAQEITSTECLNTFASGIFSSQNSFYLGHSQWIEEEESYRYETIIHKFSLADNQVTYRSTGAAPGSLNWRAPSYSMDEHNGNLRVVSTQRDSQNAPTHRLTVLRDIENSDSMEVIAQLPNESQPDLIGKPGEDIFAVRFHGDRAFIVTFEQIDPLYVLDLSTANAPFVAGELEIPGFSTYLHPVGNSYLLGVGHNVDNQNRNSGIKVSLFDVRTDTPTELGSVILGSTGTWSPSTFDARALTFLQSTPDKLRMTLPVSVYDNNNWQNEALHMFEVNGLTAENASLQHAGEIISERRTEDILWPRSYGVDRSVLHADAVYYIHGNTLHSEFWGASSPNPAP